VSPEDRRSARTRLRAIAITVKDEFGYRRTEAIEETRQSRVKTRAAARETA
jgi:hypothetical protein